MEYNNYRYPDFDPEDFLKNGCLSAVVAFLIVAGGMILCSLLAGCSAPEKTSSYIEQHQVERMMERMDSVIQIKTVAQQDSSWRETILKQFQSIREKSDTSHTFVVDSAGKVIKEKLVINNIRETTSESDRQEREVLKKRLEVMDMTIDMMRESMSLTDSLLRAKEEQTVKEVEKPLSWWQNLRLWLGNIVLVALAVAAVVWVVKKKHPWFTRLFRN